MRVSDPTNSTRMNVGLLPSDLMSKAQIRPFPNVGAVDPRIPSLDPCSADSILFTDCSARRRVGYGLVILTVLWVRWGELGHTNGQVGVCPNIRAVDKAVRGGNGPGLQGELGLDGVTATHELVLSRQNESIHLRKLTTSLLPSFGSHASRN